MPLNHYALLTTVVPCRLSVSVVPFAGVSFILALYEAEHGDTLFRVVRTPGIVYSFNLFCEILFDYKVWRVC